MLMSTLSSPTDRQQTILLYSDDVTVREAVRSAVGAVARSGGEPLRWVEVASYDAVVGRADEGGIDLMILDGETDKAGGMGVCRQLKNEIFNCPPVLLLTGRPQDAWLASWSLADAAVPRPLDPVELQRAARSLLLARVADGAVR